MDRYSEALRKLASWMRYLSEADVLRMHELTLERFGGSDSVWNRGGLDSVVHQPMPSFVGEDLYPIDFAKAAALGYSPIRNHPSQMATGA